MCRRDLPLAAATMLVRWGQAIGGAAICQDGYVVLFFPSKSFPVKTSIKVTRSWILILCVPLSASRIAARRLQRLAIAKVMFVSHAFIDNGEFFASTSLFGKWNPLSFVFTLELLRDTSCFAHSSQFICCFSVRFDFSVRTLAILRTVQCSGVQNSFGLLLWFGSYGILVYSS